MSLGSNVGGDSGSQSLNGMNWVCYTGLSGNVTLLDRVSEMRFKAVFLSLT